MSDTVIKVQNLSKRYRIGLKEERHDTFTGQMMAMLKAPVRNFRQLRGLSKFKGEDESVFWALRDINFEVKQGEVLGIIGHNGAGKSTLLKILSHITEPTTGEVHLKGRVSALLEVGTGFHPELTGRENIYMNGTILGMTKKEIDRKLDEIVDFSGVEKHIDTPVKFYSSGMKVRLGFSVAAHLEPEILIIDEVLAVGDAEFQKKCLGKMETISQNLGKTLLFVSHNLSAIQSICDRIIILKNGIKKYDGDTVSGINTYNSNIKLTELENLDSQNSVFFNESLNKNGLTEVDYNEGFTLSLKIKPKENFSGSLYLILNDHSGENIIHQRIDNITLNTSSNKIEFLVPPIWLRPGVYNYHFKLINADLANEKNKHLSEIYTLKINGNVEAPSLLGKLTPNIKFLIN